MVTHPSTNRQWTAGIVELVTCWSQVRRPNHYTTKPVVVIIGLLNLSCIVCCCCCCDVSIIVDLTLPLFTGLQGDGKWIHYVWVSELSLAPPYFSVQCLITTRKPCYRNENRAMCPEKFRESLATPTAAFTIPPQFWGCSRCTRWPMLGSARAGALSYSAVKLFSMKLNSNLCDHDTWTPHTDGQTDGQYTIAVPRFALYRASRCKNILW